MVVVGATRFCGHLAPRHCFLLVISVSVRLLWLMLYRSSVFPRDKLAVTSYKITPSVNQLFKRKTVVFAGVSQICSFLENLDLSSIKCRFHAKLRRNKTSR